MSAALISIPEQTKLIKMNLHHDYPRFAYGLLEQIESDPYGKYRNGAVCANWIWHLEMKLGLDIFGEEAREAADNLQKYFKVVYGDASYPFNSGSCINYRRETNSEQIWKNHNRLEHLRVTARIYADLPLSFRTLEYVGFPKK